MSAHEVVSLQQSYLMMIGEKSFLKHESAGTEEEDENKNIIIIKRKEKKKKSYTLDFLL